MDIKGILKKTLYATPSLLADIMRLKPNWNRDKYVFLKLLQRGDVILDVGGNIGDYCKTFSEITGNTGHVYTFEPVPPTIKTLGETLGKRGSSNVTLVPKAVSNAQGQIEIHMPGEDHARPAILLSERESWGQSVQVKSYPCEAITLDSFVSGQGLERVDFVKVDVEGAEHLVLAGAKNLLMEQSPILFFEMWDSYMRDFGTTPATFYKLLRQAGYDQFICVQGILRHFTNLETELPGLLTGGILNLVCGKKAIHRKRFASFQS
jgi:FkbM family methyltransferase